MLYKYLFSIFSEQLNLNQKKEKIEFGRLPIIPTGYQSNRPVNRSEPIEIAILNLIGFWSNRSVKPLPDRSVYLTLVWCPEETDPGEQEQTRPRLPGKHDGALGRRRRAHRLADRAGAVKFCRSRF